MADIEDYDTTPANNTADWPENQAPSTVNNAGRESQADIAKFRERIQGEATVGGTVDAITLTYSVAHTALVDNRVHLFEAAGANATTTPTLQVDSLTAKTITKYGNQALVAGDIYGAGHRCIVQYDSGNDVYELLNPATNIKPSFSVHRNGTTQNNITSVDKIEWTTEEYDTNSNFDNATNYRFTPTVAGKYLLTANVELSGTVSGDLLVLYLYKNGVEYKDTTKNAAGTIESLVLTAVVDANGSSDYFEIWAQNIARDTSDVTGDSARSHWSGCKID